MVEATESLAGHSYSFDEKKHEYRIDGVVVASVTGVLAENNLIDSRWFTQEARDRGTRVHFATQLLDEDDLYWPSVLKEDVGYIKSWELFKTRNNVEIIDIEKRLFDPKTMNAGTFDRRLRMHGDSGIYLFDIKTVGDGKGKPPFYTKYQVAAYEGMYRSIYGGPECRKASIVLQADGSIPRVYEYDDPNDYADFLTLSYATKIRKRHNRENKRYEE